MKTQNVPLNERIASAEVCIEIYTRLVERNPDDNHYVKRLREFQRELLDLRLEVVRRRMEEA